MAMVSCGRQYGTAADAALMAPESESKVAEALERESRTQ
jgi:hypothetical protein